MPNLDTTVAVCDDLPEAEKYWDALESAVQGETLDSGALAIVVISPEQSTNGVSNTLKGTRLMTTVPSATTEEIQQAMS